MRILAAVTAAAAAIAPSATAPPTIAGSLTQGQTLTATSGSWSGAAPIAFTYQWQRCDATGASCANIAGAAAEVYTLTLDDVGHTLRAAVTAANAAGSAAATSNRTGIVQGADAPASTAPPTVAGTPAVGATLTAAPGGWTGSTPLAYAYVWERCDTSGASCAPIAGAAAQTYVPGAADAGHTLRVAVTATSPGGSAQAISAATDAVGSSGPANAGQPALTGTPAQGSLLSVTSGSWNGSAPIGYAYAWQRCDAAGRGCVPIPGATATTYALLAADVGSTICVLVTASNGSGTSRITSNVVGPVAAVSTLPAGATRLPDGKISVAAASLAANDRLSIASVAFSPRVVRRGSVVTATFTIADASGYAVSGALVGATAQTRAWAAPVPEAATAQNGVVHLRIRVSASAPGRGALVLVVLARTPQGGSAARRLVRVRIRP